MKKYNKQTHTGKAEVKLLFLFAYDMILYVKNPKKPTKNPLELINRFSKVAGSVIGILGSHPTPETKTNLKRITAPNVRAETINLLEENPGIDLHDLK